MPRRGAMKPAPGSNCNMLVGRRLADEVFRSEEAVAAPAAWESVNTVFGFATDARAERPPPDQERGAERQEEMNESGGRGDDESQDRPGHERSQSQQKCRGHGGYLVGLVDGVWASSYFTSEWTSVGRYVIEPTGPMKGPNAVVDVMPLGGRQMSW